MARTNGAVGVSATVKGKRINRAEAAELLGQSIDQIKRAEKRGMPTLVKLGRRGKEVWYDSVAIIEWDVRRRLEDELRRRGLSDEAPVENDEAREKRLKADLLELKYERERGALLPAAEVARADQALMAMIHDNMLAIPVAAAEALHDAAHRDGPAGIAEVLTGYIERALTDAAEAEFEAIDDGADHQGDGIEADGEDEEGGARAAEATAEADDL